MKTILFLLTALTFGTFAEKVPTLKEIREIACEGIYPLHPQGAATDGTNVYWSFTRVFVKTDFKGKILAKDTIDYGHMGDLCYHDGKIYVGMNMSSKWEGKTRVRTGDEVWQYDAATLKREKEIPTPQTIFCNNGIEWYTFKTEDEAPRMIRIPGVPNARDLGGRIGWKNRRVKQGLIYRSQGMNGNATGPANNRKPGRIRLSAETAAWLRDGLGIKSDVDLRSDPEVEFMKESPLGPTVTWFRFSSAEYGGMGVKKGKADFVKCFRYLLDRNHLPAIIHCISGADRTGSHCCILNGLLGVSEEDLYRDWETTGIIRHSPKFNHKERFDHLMNVFKRYPGETITDRIVAYAKDCGITDEEIARFREMMLEPAK